MNSTFNMMDHLNRTKENFQLQTDFVHALQKYAKAIKGLKVLDYGAGVGGRISTYSMLNKEQDTVVAYDPSAPEGIRDTGSTNLAKTEWVRKEPLGKSFHLVICSFSLHHAGLSLDKITTYNPGLIAITDYDYTRASLKQFEETWIAQQETIELKTQFGDDIAACYEFHQQYSKKDYSSALEQSGYKIVEDKTGKGIARFKFYIIAKRI